MTNEVLKNTISVFIILCLVIPMVGCSQGKTMLKKNPNFKPPKNLETKRTYVMKAEGTPIGKMEAVRQVDTSKKELLIKDIAHSLVGFDKAFDNQVEETFWLGANGLVEYKGKFTNLNTNEVFNNKFKLKGKVLYFESISSKGLKPFKQKFIKGKDYHTATIYINPTDREMKPGKEYKRKMLDVSFARTMKLEEKFLRMDKFTLGENTFDCHVIYIDYGHLHGEVWLAKDELGWFLIYEKATATEGSFELVLDSYTRTMKN